MGVGEILVQDETILPKILWILDSKVLFPPAAYAFMPPAGTSKKRGLGVEGASGCAKFCRSEMDGV